MPRLVIGSRNAKKLHELQDLLGDLAIELVDLSGWPNVADVEETGQTFEENARLKAAAYAKATGEWVLAEDSGLVVPALKGRPGVYSARYAGTHGDDAANNQKLLAELAPLPDDRRAAYYVCVAALAFDTGRSRELFRRVAGSGAPAPREYPAAGEDAKIKLARLAIADGDHDTALAWLTRVREKGLPRELRRSLVQLRVQASAAQGEVLGESVEAELRTALRKFPDDVPLLGLLRELLLRRGEIEEAAATQEKIVAVVPALS